MTTVPYGSDQHSNIVYVDSIDGIGSIIDSYLERHSSGDGTEYYLHIDHLHVFEPLKNGRYAVLIIFHRVYLYKDVPRSRTKE